MALNVKRNCVSLETKLKILDEIDKRRSYKSIGAEFGISKSCVAGVHRNRDFIYQLKPVRNQVNLKRKRLRLAKHPDLELALLAWVKLVRSVDDAALSGPLLAEKAMSIAKELNIVDFKASEGWLARFKERNSLKFRHSGPKSEDRMTNVKPKSSDDFLNSSKISVDQETGDDVIEFSSLNGILENFKEDNFPCFSDMYETTITSAIAIENSDCDSSIDNTAGKITDKAVESFFVDNKIADDRTLTPSLKDAKIALIILRRFLTTTDSNGKTLKHVDDIEKFVNSCQTDNTVGQSLK